MKTEISTSTKMLIYSINTELEAVLIVLFLVIAITYLLPKLFAYWIEKDKITTQTKKEIIENDIELKNLKKEYTELIKGFSAKENQLILQENNLKTEWKNYEKEKSLFEKEKKANRDIIEDLKFLVNRIKDKKKREPLQDEILRIVSEEINDKTKTDIHE